MLPFRYFGGGGDVVCTVLFGELSLAVMGSMGRRKKTLSWKSTINSQMFQMWLFCCCVQLTLVTESENANEETGFYGVDNNEK